MDGDRWSCRREKGHHTAVRLRDGTAVRMDYAGRMGALVEEGHLSRNPLVLPPWGFKPTPSVVVGNPFAVPRAHQVLAVYGAHHDHIGVL